MAYASDEFYTEVYGGKAVPEDDFPKYAEQASDFIDVMTFDRLSDDFPTDERQAKRIRKAVCAMAEKLYQIDLAQQQAIAGASGSTTTTTESGTTTGVVTAKSAGNESISYATPQQMGASAKEWSAVFSAAGNAQATNDILLKTALPYLMGVKTSKGIPILYAEF